jgi:hypothetical protein
VTINLVKAALLPACLVIFERPAFSFVNLIWRTQLLLTILTASCFPFFFLELKIIVFLGFFLVGQGACLLLFLFHIICRTGIFSP